MTQGQRILQHLEQGKTLNRLNSWHELGILEAPARISELKQQGHEINTKMIPVINRYKQKVSIAEWSLKVCN